MGMLLDALLGEPKWLWNRLPHPAVLMGRVIGWADTRFNTGRFRKVKGVAVVAGLVGAAALLGVVLSWGGTVVEVVVVAVLLAQRSLVDHVRAVAAGLRRSLPEGRRNVAMIVGRETASMDDSAVSRAAIESAAENLSDGVIAPALWFAVAGLPGLLVYKIVNTADSMIGYRTPRHAAFGWAAARLDDVLNLVPARITAVLIAPLAVWQLRRDARLHRSPNAGWPEAAMARRLDIALSGPRAYDGKMQDFAWVNAGARHSGGPRDIEAACGVLWQAWGGFLGVALLAWLL
nr:adenosylcobinamide-phosphate synthase CbiB [Nereida sp. MMG025]